MLALVISLALAAAAPKAFVPPVIKEPAVPPNAWFVEDLKHHQWCEFDSRKTAEAFSARQQFAPEDTPGAAWVRIEDGKLSSVTVQMESDDAFTEDRYFFDAAGRVTELRRTGLYVQNKRATYVFKPGPGGKLTATPETKALLRRVEALDYETYFLDWDRYTRFSELPFASLIATQDGQVTVKTGCTVPPKTKNKRR